MILYFADRTMKILGKASTNLETGYLISSDELTEDVETGLTVLDVTIKYNEDEQIDLEKITDAGNYILYSNDRRTGYFTIVDSEIVTSNYEIQIYAEDAGLDLMNEIVGPYEATSAQNIQHYINRFSTDSGFEIRFNEFNTNTTKKLAWDDNVTATERLLSVAKEFEAELGFSFAIEGMDIIHKYIDIYKKRGKENNAQLRMGYEISDLRIKRSVANLVTALEVNGPSESSFDPVYTAVSGPSGNPKNKGYYIINNDGNYSKTSDTSVKSGTTYYTKMPPDRAEGEDPKDVNFSYPSQISYNDGSDFYISGTRLYSRKANEKWSRYLYKNEPNQLNNSGYIVGYFEYTDVAPNQTMAQFQTTLRNKALEELKKLCVKEITYEADILVFPDNISLGDIVNIIDDAGENYVSARLMQIKRSVTNDTITCTFGDFKAKDSGISAKVQALADSFEKIAKVRQLYTWIAYADDEEGNGVSLDPTGKKYIGVATSRFEATPDLVDLSPYTWSLYVGADGADGVDGLSPTITTYHDDTNHQLIIYSVTGSETPVIIGYIPDAEDGHTPTITTTKANGVTTVYADNIPIGTINDGVSARITSATKQGTTTTIVFTDSDGTHTIEIEDGQDGANGQPGAAGADGTSSYIHTAWANSLAPTYDGFSTSDSTNKLYLGVYTDSNVADSATPSDYNWSLIKGQDGKGISSTVVTYGVGNSGTDHSNVTWGNPDVIPDVPQGKYLWTRTTITYTDNTTKNSYSVAYKAANGINGQDAKNITTVTTQYCLLADGVTPTDQTTFYNTPPSYERGKKYWRRDYILFEDNTHATSVPVIDNSLNDAMEAAMAAIVSDVKQYCIASSDTECKVYTYTQFAGSTFLQDVVYYEKVESLLNEEDESTTYYIYIHTADTTPQTGKTYYYVDSQTGKADPTWYDKTIYDVITSETKTFFENDYIWSRNKVTYGSGVVEYLNTTVESISNLFTRNITYDASINELDDQISITASSIGEVSEKFDPIEERIATIENNAILSVEPGAITGTISEYVVSKVNEGIDNSGLDEAKEQLRSVTAQLTTDGFTVSKSDQGTSSLIDGEGLKVVKTVGSDSVTIAQFTNDDSYVDYLRVNRFLAFGAHQAELIEMYEYDGVTETLGTGFFYVGAQNQNRSN